MRKLVVLLNLAFGLIATQSWATTCNVPSSTYTYAGGSVIEANQVQTNENNLYTYDQQGVCNYLAGSISQAAISSTAGILYSQLNLSGGILPGDINTATTTSVYQFENLTVPFGAIFQGAITVGGSEGTLGQSIISQGLNSNPSWGYSPYVKVSNTQTSGTGGGSITTGSWQTAIINTKDSDTASIATLTSNAVSLPAGTYFAHASMPLWATGSGISAQIRLFNSTDSAILINGQNGFNAASSNVGIVTILTGIFTISATKSVILQYQASNGSTNGQGVPFSFGTEVYAVVEFSKIS